MIGLAFTGRPCWFTEAFVTASVDIGGTDLNFSTGATQPHAWTARLAQQSLQVDFDPALVRLFDKASQGTVMDGLVGDSQSVSVTIGGGVAGALQADLTAAYGFAEFSSNGDSVRIARAVAVAETAGGADDQMAIVRVRQNGEDNVSVTFYRVDDLTGAIGGVAPGQAGYREAALANAYELASGGTSLGGIGYGNFRQTMLLDVDAGDHVAMALTNGGRTYWGFSQANPDGLAHLWSYGLNTWGWEDVFNGGDRDYNDLIVQLDFTSAAGSQWLV